MKLERKHKLRIIMAIAILLILYGIFDGIFGFGVDPKLVSNVSMVFMVIAFALLFSDRRKRGSTINKVDDNSDVQEKQEEQIDDPNTK